jgi:alpha-mannosidase
MTYDDLTLLIPSHSLEDFPTELGEKEAGGLLNGFAVLWHPRLLATAKVLPNWHRSDEPPTTLANRLIIVPPPCVKLLPGGWAEQAERDGAVVVSDLDDRAELIDATLDPLEEAEPLASDLVADFLALGTCHLLLELLTRQMHHFDSLNETYLQQQAVAAAAAAVANDSAAARTHLTTCFEVLLEARERFYPVESYLLDLCLLIPSMADEDIEAALSAGTAINFVAAAADLDQIATRNPELAATMRKLWDEGQIDISGGELNEDPTPLADVESVLWQFEQGHGVFRSLFGRTPTTWARRRYGLSTLMPQILNRFGYHSALHVALDDGIYPDAEQSRIEWEGCDGTVIDAITRIPLAADSASSFLRFPARLAESMQEDHLAALLLARWPEMTSPWLDDLQRMHGYAPLFGKFVTFEEFFQNSADPGHLSTFEAREYLTPFLIQAVAAEEPDPISRYVDSTLRRTRFEAGRWYRAVAALLSKQPIGDECEATCERLLTEAGPDRRCAQHAPDPEKQNETECDSPETPATIPDSASSDSLAEAEKVLGRFVDESQERLAEAIMKGSGRQPGMLLLNSLTFPRRVSVDVPEGIAAPLVGGPVQGLQQNQERNDLTVEIPACGFLWLPAAGGNSPNSTESYVPMAVENLLRNEFFEVHLNESTGGIGKLKEYGRQPNRLSQQLAFRFPRERTVPGGDEADSVPERTYYSEMRSSRSTVTCDGPSLGEIVTSGVIIDQANGSELAGFRQTFRVWRGRPVLELDLELDIHRMPEGDPWSNYYAARFAYGDSTAALTRSVQQGTHGFSGQRFESPHYLEIATESERVTILNGGLPFHRHTGERMIDSLLLTAGETKRSFRFVIAFDANYPLQAALDAMTPPAVLFTDHGPPPSGAMGWFFHISARNVQISRVIPLMDETPSDAAVGDLDQWHAAAGDEGFALRLIETEGRHGQVKLRCYRTPVHARQRDFCGRTLSELRIIDDTVHIEMAPYEIADVELRYDTVHAAAPGQATGITDSDDRNH